MRVRIKICGITCLEDAQLAVHHGADALGFMFYAPSKRCISRELARSICRALPPCVTKVGVFVNATREDVTETLNTCGLDVIQFHGDETPENCQHYPVKTMRAFRVHDASSLVSLEKYHTDAWLVDSFQPDQRGGTGHAFQWDLLSSLRPYSKPLFLAGGLGPDNIRRAIEEVQPFGVDVSSGVEASAGRKCPQKLAAFIKGALSVHLDSSR
jgi:phosphoribosylanthranilate isomerase